jgi:hypothetical protein
MMTDFLFFLPLLAILGLVIWALTSGRRRGKSKAVKVDLNTRRDRSVWAWGRVLASTVGTLNLVNQARVELTIEVHLPGTPAYQAKTTWLVDQDALGYVEAGKDVNLKVDPQGPEYVFPNGPWAQRVE